MSNRLLVRLVLALVVAGGAWYGRRATAISPGSPPAATTAAAPTVANHGEIGFRDSQHLREHYQKHGREFGSIGQSDYLHLAQALRDGPAGGDILQAVRTDGVVTRFDRTSGAFLAFDPDLTIRTFFKPNDGERYYRRQLARGPSQE
jgi:pyocin large subunit-like protein